MNCHQVKSLWPTEKRQKKKTTHQVNKSTDTYWCNWCSRLEKCETHVVSLGLLNAQNPFLEVSCSQFFDHCLIASRSIDRKTNLIMHLPFKIIYNLENYLLKSVYLCLPFVFTSYSVCSLSLCLSVSVSFVWFRIPNARPFAGLSRWKKKMKTKTPNTAHTKIH